jgi:hypothetical protein
MAMHETPERLRAVAALPDRCLELPGGVLDAAGQVHRRVRVRELTGADEELLFERSRGGGAQRVSAFLARAIAVVEGLDAPIDEAFTAGMHLGDRDYLLLRLRQLDLGDAVHQVMRCAACAMKVDVDLSISELPVRRLADPRPAYRLSLGGRELLVRLPTGADQDAVEAVALANPAAANTRLYARLVLDVDGAGAPDQDAVRAWPAGLRAELNEWLQEHSPGPDLFLDLACPHCAADMSYAFDLYAFFFAERMTYIDRLYEEIHVLALHYHWSEAALLGLPRSKRRRYLGLLAAHSASAESRA